MKFLTQSIYCSEVSINEMMRFVNTYYVHQTMTGISIVDPCSNHIQHQLHWRSSSMTQGKKKRKKPLLGSRVLDIHSMIHMGIPQWWRNLSSCEPVNMIEMWKSIIPTEIVSTLRLDPNIKKSIFIQTYYFWPLKCLN